jgi:chaperonin GroES
VAERFKALVLKTSGWKRPVSSNLTTSANQKETMSIRPLYDNVAVKQSDTEETTQSGLVIPGSKASEEQGTVIAVGEGQVLQDGTIRPLTVKVGDTVLFTGKGASLVTVDGADVLVFRERDLLAIIE